jgi:hypothetical protein
MVECLATVGSAWFAATEPVQPQTEKGINETKRKVHESKRPGTERRNSGKALSTPRSVQRRSEL